MSSGDITVIHCNLHKLTLLNKMGARSHGSVHDSMRMFEASRINVQGCTSFPIKDELKKLSINVISKIKC